MRDLNFLRPAGYRVNRKPPSPKTTLGVFVAAFVILVGIFNAPAILSSVSYRLTYSEEEENQRLTDQYRSLYGQQARAVATDQPVSGTPTPTPKRSVQVAPRKPGLISISKIGVSAPVLEVSSAADAVVLKALKNGVVMYPGSADPGSGTTVIIGHSSSPPPWTKYSAIFSRLEKLTRDDIINISFGGKDYTYRVSGIEHGSVEELLNSGIVGDLILSSCWPIGTDQGRIVVIAKLIR